MDIFSDFLKRLDKHILLVKYYGSILSEYLEQDKERFLNDIKHHDESKFSKYEKDGYIYINAHYNLGYEYPSKDVEYLARNAWIHHYIHNNHHPEYWPSCNEMPKYVIAHMVADWKAMEGVNINSIDIYSFWEKVGNKKYKWDKRHINWIREFMGELS